MEQQKRIGVVGIVLEDPKTSAAKVNAIIGEYSEIIAGRMGIPNHERASAVIALTVDGTTDKIGALTGKLGRLPGVSVKSALTGL